MQISTEVKANSPVPANHNFLAPSNLELGSPKCLLRLHQKCKLDFIHPANGQYNAHKKESIKYTIQPTLLDKQHCAFVNDEQMIHQ